MNIITCIYIEYTYFMRLNGLKEVKNVYFIGIGGISMSGLAKLLLHLGYEVSGSDGTKSELIESLSRLGASVYIGEDGEREKLKQADIVVYTDAIPPMHAELITARRMQKHIFSRAEFLQTICGTFSKTLAVAGSHGKTTCTCMCAHVLKQTGVPFTAHIGGEDSSFGNFYTSGYEYFLTEACEYKKNLLKIPADTALVLNIDRDHMECYQDEEELLTTFFHYCKSARTAFVCADDIRCRHLGDFPCFGIDAPFADYRATDLRASGERYAFTVEEYGKPLCRVQLKAIGKCNVYNALGTFALMRAQGFNDDEIRRGVEAFTAVKRRFEKIGVFHGASVVCDYAHHPKEILSTLITAQGVCKGKLYVIFQPHTYSRTKLLMNEFVSVLRQAENLMIYKTFPARERYDSEGSAQTLAQNVGGCLYGEDLSTLRLWLTKTVKEGDMVLCLGAGDIYYAMQYMVRELN